MTREQWLESLTEELRKTVTAQAPAAVPDRVRVSCGWPVRGGMAQKKRRIGECWSHECAADQVHQIFISPYIADPLEVAATLVHELGHAAVGVDKKHGGAFKRWAKAVGLAGKATATHAGDELKAKLTDILASLPAYPHVSLNAMTSTTKKQGTRMLKLVCEVKDCECGGYTVRTTKKWLEVGVPKCPKGSEMTAEDNGEDDSDGE